MEDALHTVLHSELYVHDQDALPPPYSSELINARVFQAAASKAGWQPSRIEYSDTASNAFMQQAVRIIRSNQNGIEALSIPKNSMQGDYYLVNNDSLYRLLPIPVKIIYK